MNLLSCVCLFVTPWTVHPWNFPGKSTRVGCHFLLQYSWKELPKISVFTYLYVDTYFPTYRDLSWIPTLPLLSNWNYWKGSKPGSFCSSSWELVYKICSLHPSTQALHKQFDYAVHWCSVIHGSLLGYWVTWNCGFIVFIKFGHFQWLCLQLFFLSFLPHTIVLLSFTDSSCMIIRLLMLCPSSVVSVFNLFPHCASIWRVPVIVFKFIINLFFCNV